MQKEARFLPDLLLRALLVFVTLRFHALVVFMLRHFFTTFLFDRTHGFLLDY